MPKAILFKSHIHLGLLSPLITARTKCNNGSLQTA